MQFQSITVVAYDAYMQVADITTHYENVENQGMHEGESPSILYNLCRNVKMVIQLNLMSCL